MPLGPPQALLYSNLIYFHTYSYCSYYRTLHHEAMASSRSFDYLESLPGTVFNKLYQQPSTALAIFRRMLPDLGMYPSIPRVRLTT